MDTHFEAIKVTKEKHKFTFGILYQTQLSIFHSYFYEAHNPFTKKTRKARLYKKRKGFEMKKR